jgi:hypothetical protein
MIGETIRPIKDRLFLPGVSFPAILDEWRGTPESCFGRLHSRPLPRSSEDLHPGLHTLWSNAPLLDRRRLTPEHADLGHSLWNFCQLRAKSSASVQCLFWGEKSRKVRNSSRDYYDD